MDHSNIPYSSSLEFSYSRLYTRALAAILCRFMTQTRAIYLLVNFQLSANDHPY